MHSSTTENYMGKMTNRVSLQDVATAAGVHVSTVSLALRDDPRLAEATKARVKATAERLGYVANPLVSAWLRQVRQPEVAQAGAGLAFFLGLQASEKVATEPYYRLMIEGARAEATTLGYVVTEVIFGRGDDKHLLQTINQLRYRGVRGVLLFDPAECITARIAQELQDGFAVVVMLRGGSASAFHRVGTDISYNVALALQKLREAGCRRIAFPVKAELDRVRKEALAAYLLHQRLWPAAERVPLPEQDIEHDAPLLVDWVRAQQPDAILSVNYLLHQYLLEAGLRIPGDLRYAHLGVDARPSLAGVLHRGADVGSTAVFQLAGLIAANRFGVPAIPLNTLVPGVWREALEPLPEPTVPVSDTTVNIQPSGVGRGPIRRGQAASA